MRKTRIILCDRFFNKTNKVTSLKIIIKDIEQTRKMEAISVPKGFKVTPEQFEQLAYAEQLARMELTKDGELIDLFFLPEFVLDLSEIF